MISEVRFIPNDRQKHLFQSDLVSLWGNEHIIDTDENTRFPSQLINVFSDIPSTPTVIKDRPGNV